MNLICSSALCPHYLISVVCNSSCVQLSYSLQIVSIFVSVFFASEHINGRHSIISPISSKRFLVHVMYAFAYFFRQHRVCMRFFIHSLGSCSLNSKIGSVKKCAWTNRYFPPIIFGCIELAISITADNKRGLFKSFSI